MSREEGLGTLDVESNVFCTPRLHVSEVKRRRCLFHSLFTWRYSVTFQPLTNNDIGMDRFRLTIWNSRKLWYNSLLKGVPERHLFPVYRHLERPPIQPKVCNYTSGTYQVGKICIVHYLHSLWTFSYIGLVPS